MSAITFAVIGGSVQHARSIFCLCLPRTLLPNN
jgi:hypothetical protein